MLVALFPISLVTLVPLHDGSTPSAENTITQNLSIAKLMYYHRTNVVSLYFHISLWYTGGV
jgi:hypothetical protein